MNLRLLWLASLASLLLSLAGASVAAKLYSDPSGHHAGGSGSGASADNGCQIDPHGGCPSRSSSASGDDGSSMDPDG